MSVLLKKAIIEDIVNTNCTDSELELLLDIFTGIFKRTATTTARKAWFELQDHQLAKRMGLGRFTLMLERKVIAGQKQWWGEFKHGNKKLHVIGTLED